MPTKRAHGYLGWKRDLPDPRDHKFSVARLTLQALPSKVDLAPAFPVYDQGQIGSCTANALAAAVQFDRIKNQQGPDFVPSRLFIYYNERSIEGDIPLDGGAYLRDGMKSLSQQGVCPETDWNYQPTPPATEGGPFPVGSKPATQPPQACYDEAVKYRITNYKALDQSLPQLQGCLASGYPFVFGFSVFQSWWQDPAPTVVPYPAGGESTIGGHAVLCTGYDNATGLFKFRNSWGPAEGDNGYFYIPYAYVTATEYASDFWVINAVND
jgi:C1A family cysteine protease